MGGVVTTANREMKKEPGASFRTHKDGQERVAKKITFVLGRIGVDGSEKSLLAISGTKEQMGRVMAEITKIKESKKWKERLTITPILINRTSGSVDVDGNTTFVNAVVRTLEKNFSEELVNRRIS